MKGYYRKIEEYINELSAGTIFEASGLYKNEFSELPEASYYKTLERLSQNGVLNHFSKGVYSVSKTSSFGNIPVSDTEIVNYYTRNNQGIIIGYRLYSEKGITTQVSKNIDVLSTAIEGSKKSVKNVRIKKSRVELNNRNVPIIETLEILQNYPKIEDVNNKSLYKYMRSFAENYSDEETLALLSDVKYKKSTIAFLRNFLDEFGVPNKLNSMLSSLSNYAVPSREEINGFA